MTCQRCDIIDKDSFTVRAMMLNITIYVNLSSIEENDR